MQGHQGYPDTFVHTKSPTEDVIGGGDSFDFRPASGCRRDGKEETSATFNPELIQTRRFTQKLQVEFDQIGRSNSTPAGFI